MDGNKLSSLQARAPVLEREVDRFGSIAKLFMDGPARVLAALACRVKSSPHRLVVLGTTEVFGGLHQSGLTRLLGVLEGPMRLASKRCAAQNAAVSAWRIGDLSLALDLIGQATQGKGVPPAMWLDSLLFATRARDIRRMINAAKGVEDCIDAKHPAFQEGVRTTRDLMMAVGGKPESDVVGFARKHESALTESAKSFLAETLCRESQAGTEQ